MARTWHHSRKWGRRHLFRLFPGNFYGSTPGHWVRDYMNQPKRAANRRLARAVAADRRDADAIPWPLGSRRPHIYYW